MLTSSTSAPSVPPIVSTPRVIARPATSILDPSVVFTRRPSGGPIAGPVVGSTAVPSVVVTARSSARPVAGPAALPTDGAITLPSVLSALALALALAAPTTSHAAHSVEGNTISWSDDGWYQVQRPETGERSVCDSDSDPERACTVPDGIYTVIRFADGSRERTDGIVVPPTPDGDAETTDEASAPTSSDVTALPENGPGSLTSPVGPQPGTDGTCLENADAWEFLDDGATRVYFAAGDAPDFQGACNPGGGIITNVYAPSTWRGDALVNTGTPGSNFWIDWRNTGSANGGHVEFDISMSRSLDRGRAQGYGRLTLGEIEASGVDLVMTSRGAWQPSARDGVTSPTGKTHVQGIIWLADGPGLNANAGSTGNGQCGGGRHTIDITIVEYMNEIMRDNYTRLEDVNPVTQVSIENFDPGHGVYDIYVRDPGDICEVASYIAIRERDSFGTEFAASTIDAGAFIRALSDKGYITDDWYISRMGWEIAGASGSPWVPELVDSAGKFVFDCYSIPDLTGAETEGPGYDACR